MYLIQGINNKIKFGHLLPNKEIEIKNLKSFFHKCKNKTEEQLLDEIKKDDKIILNEIITPEVKAEVKKNITPEVKAGKTEK